MQRHFISKIISSAMRLDRRLIEEASKKFFEQAHADLEMIQPIYLGMFLEWFIFDYKIPGFKNYIEKYAEENPDDHSTRRVNAYRTLNRTQIYRLFQVKEISPNIGLTFVDVMNNNEYFVNEKSLTHQARIDSQLFVRIGEIDGHYEIVSADTQMPPRFSANYIKEIADILENVTPKDVYAKFLKIPHTGDNDNGIEPDQYTSNQQAKSPIEAEQNLKNTLNKFRLNQFISTHKIASWFYNTIGTTNMVMEAASMVTGLLDDKEYTKENLREIIDALSDFYAYQPQKSLSGKSPIELKEEYKDKERRPDEFIVDFSNISREFINHEVKARALMQDQQFEDALIEYELMFADMASQHTTLPHIYRIIANYASLQFILGNRYRGEYYLDQSLKLNPNYDFGIHLKSELKKGTLNPTIKYGIYRKVKERSDFEHRVRLYEIQYMKKDEVYRLMKKLKIKISESEMIRLMSKADCVEDLAYEVLKPFFPHKFDYETDVLYEIASNLWIEHQPEKADRDIIIDLISRLTDRDDKEKYSSSELTALLVQQVSNITPQIQKSISYELDHSSYMLRLMEYSIENWSNDIRKIIALFRDKFDSPISDLMDTIYTSLSKGDSSVLDRYEPKESLDTNYKYIQPYVIGLIYQKLNLYKEAAVIFRKLLNATEDFKYTAMVNLIHILSKFPGDELEVQELEKKLDTIDAETDADSEYLDDLDPVDIIFNNGEVDQSIKEIELQDLVNDSAYKYLKYLQSFEINFRTNELTTSEITYSEFGKSS